MQDENNTRQSPLEREVRRDLKPCPFCGKTPKNLQEEGVWRHHHKVKCGTVNCYGNPQAARTWGTKEEAEIEWNTRA